jgi:hypothetical protein
MAFTNVLPTKVAAIVWDVEYKKDRRSLSLSKLSQPHL